MINREHAEDSSLVFNKKLSRYELSESVTEIYFKKDLVQKITFPLHHKSFSVKKKNSLMTLKITAR